MKEGYRWSDFLLQVPLENGDLLLKSTLTGAVARLRKSAFDSISGKLNRDSEIPIEFEKLVDDTVRLLVSKGKDEYSAWKDRLLERRNNEADTFILHFLPTIACQLACSYCFENGGERMKGMTDEVLNKTIHWLDSYLVAHKEIKKLRLVYFGGEPLLRKDLVSKSAKAFQQVAEARGIGFWTELTTNGELVDERVAKDLSERNWQRVQISLDGPADVHNARRPSKNGKGSFDKIISNIQMLLDSEYVPSVDVRISFDHDNAANIPQLIDILSKFKNAKKLNLSLGLITPTHDRPERMRYEQERQLGEQAIQIWKYAKDKGFGIPEDFITGPWCVAIAKHSAVVQPDGSLQKCFISAGRQEFNIGSVTSGAQIGESQYIADQRYEQWKRTDECIKEKCNFLPMCGGGCIHDAIIANGNPDGGGKRFCQKSLLEVYNKGLLKLNHGGG